MEVYRISVSCLHHGHLNSLVTSENNKILMVLCSHFVKAVMEMQMKMLLKIL